MDAEEQARYDESLLAGRTLGPEGGRGQENEAGETQLSAAQFKYQQEFKAQRQRRLKSTRCKKRRETTCADGATSREVPNLNLPPQSFTATRKLITKDARGLRRPQESAPPTDRTRAFRPRGKSTCTKVMKRVCRRSDSFPITATYSCLPAWTRLCEYGTLRAIAV